MSRPRKAAPSNTLSAAARLFWNRSLAGLAAPGGALPSSRSPSLSDAEVLPSLSEALLVAGPSTCTKSNVKLVRLLEH